MWDSAKSIISYIIYRKVIINSIKKRTTCGDKVILSFRHFVLYIYGILIKYFLNLYYFLINFIIESVAQKP